MSLHILSYQLMDKQQSNTRRQHTILTIAGIIFAVCLLGGFMFFQAITHIADLLVIESEILQLPKRVRSIPLPSAFLLFSMGLLGLLCVRASEKKKQTRHSDMKNLNKAIH